MDTGYKDQRQKPTDLIKTHLKQELNEQMSQKARTKALVIEKEINKTMVAIGERSQAIEAELCEAKPALERAQKAVSNINKKQLNEIKFRRNPGRPIEMTLNAVMELMGKQPDTEQKERIKKTNKNKIDVFFKGYVESINDDVDNNKIVPNVIIDFIIKYTDPYSLGKTELQGGERIVMVYWLEREIKYSWRWGKVLRWITSNDTIPSILKFDTNNITDKMRKGVTEKYLSNDDLTFEIVNKSSKVAGALLLWVKAQIKFSHLLASVEPMIKEINGLRQRLTELTSKAQELKLNTKQDDNNLCLT